MISEKYGNEEGKPHRIDGPAFIEYDSAGWVKRESYYVDGKLHRTDGPAVVRYQSDGVVRSEEWWVEGEKDRPDGGPEEVTYLPNGQLYIETYYRDGGQHRVDGPANLYHALDGGITTEYFLDGVELEDRAHLHMKLGEMSDRRLKEEFAHSSFAPLLAEGHSARAVLAALAEDVWSAEGIRAVLEGAPSEWARSFEEGRLR